MKIIKLLSIALIAIVCSFNLLQNTQMLSDYSINLSQLKALAYDLPEVTIICSGGSYGTCLQEFQQEIHLFPGIVVFLVLNLIIVNQIDY